MITFLTILASVVALGIAFGLHARKRFNNAMLQLARTHTGARRWVILFGLND